MVFNSFTLLAGRSEDKNSNLVTPVTLKKSQRRLTILSIYVGHLLPTTISVIKTSTELTHKQESGFSTPINNFYIHTFVATT
jgi:hypothetical protein